MRKSSILKFTLSILLIFSLIIILFESTRFITSDRTWSDLVLWVTILFRSILIIAIATIIIYLFVKGVVLKDALGHIVKNILTIPVSILFFLVCFELVFMFVPQSHGSNATLSARVWASLYGKPYNSLGYRDSELAHDVASTHNVLVVGDSFTEGHGISSIDSRFSNVLARKLGTSYRVYNLGKSGADSRKEYSNLHTFPIKPNSIVLQYFGNDIQVACREKGKKFQGFKYYSELGVFETYVVKNSFFLNFIYWIFPHAAGDARYTDYMNDCYADEMVLGTHLKDLDNFIAYALGYDVPLFVVIFPFLEENAGSINQYVPVISSYFKSRNVSVISVSDLIQGLTPDERVVNRSDTHASPLVNSIVGEAIYEQMYKQRMPQQ